MNIFPNGFVFSDHSLDGSALVRPDRLTAFFNRVRYDLGYPERRDGGLDLNHRSAAGA